MTSKERRASHGATNLTARSERGSIIRKEFYRSWTHKLISPDVHQQHVKPVDMENICNNTATWRPVPLYERNFVSTTQDSYIDPKIATPIPEIHEFSEEEMRREKETRSKQIDAVEALCKTAKAHYGTTASMLKSVSYSFLVFFTAMSNFIFC